MKDKLMKDNKLWVGIFVAAAILLFGGALFLIGDQHKAFRRHTDFYAEFINLDGIAKGAKVRVNGMDAGQVGDVAIPSSPAHKFRLKMTVDDRVRGLIRDDSVVSVETAGLVGDEFLLIRGGSDRSPQAGAGATLSSKEPFEITKMLDQANGLMKQVGGTLTDVQGKLDGTLDAVTTTVNNTNGVVTDIRHGKGTAGLLLEDRKTATDVQQTLVNARQATTSLNAASTQVNSLMQDVQRRQLVAKVDDTLNSAKGATQQLNQASLQVNQASQQVNTTLKSALAQDQYGQDAGANLQQSLSNINVATGNLADDTEALKHEFFFKGFFKSRGYDNLNDLPLGPYRSGEILKKLRQDRQWIAADSLFVENADGTETLSAAGRERVDEAVSQIPGLYDSPLIVEGYAAAGTPAGQLVRSRQRATIVRGYMQIHFHLEPKETGIIGLSSEPPVGAGKTGWDGVCLVHLRKSASAR